MATFRSTEHAKSPQSPLESIGSGKQAADSRLERLRWLDGLDRSNGGEVRTAGEYSSVRALSASPASISAASAI